MADLKEVFSRIKETKQKQKEIRRMYKDALTQNMEYEKLIEQLDQLKARKKEIENDIKSEMEGDIQKLDAYRMHIKTDQEMMSDLAINQLMSGETVELVDENDQKYEPIFSVRFKKA
jgi:predicted phage-related endonuclease